MSKKITKKDANTFDIMINVIIVIVRLVYYKLNFNNFIMFSWIIEDKWIIKNIKWKIFEIEFNFDEYIKIWQSIAHDWVCLTVIKVEWKIYQVEIMPETLSKTNLWYKKVWDYINLERSIKLWDRLDWHMVQGHVDCTWTLENIEEKENSKILKISFPEDYSNYFVEKWSVCLNWISLTIILAWKNFFTVWIIPHTWKITNLSDLKIWDKLNIETDIIWKYLNKHYSIHLGW